MAAWASPAARSACSHAPALQQGLNVVAPLLQGDAHLVGIVVDLVDADDPPERAALMPERALDHRDRNAEALQSDRAGAAQVVQAPVLADAGELAQSRLGLAP